MVKTNSRWIVRNFKSKSFVLDDESYFSLSKSQMTESDIYFPQTSKIFLLIGNKKFKMKFESKNDDLFNRI